MRLKCLIFIASYIMAIMLCSHASAVSSNVPLESDLYEKLEKLQAFGLIDDFVSGMKPLSRREFARQIRSAFKNRKSIEEPMPLVDAFLDLLRKEFEYELSEDKDISSVKMMKQASAEIIFLKEHQTPHLETDSFNKPLVSERTGLNPNDGANFLLRSYGYIDFKEHFALYLEPAMLIRQNGSFTDQNMTSGNGRHFDLNFPRGNIKTGFKNFELLLGRDTVCWGNAFSGKIQMSNNIEGMTMAKISNPRPFYLPWIFKYLGLFKIEFLFAMLEEERARPNPTFWGTAVMFKPWKYMEWGFSRTTMLGGAGTDSLGFWEYFAEAVTGLRVYDSSIRNPGNGTFGFYFMFILPFLRNSRIYFDGYLEDFGFGNITRKDSFTRDLAFSTGIDIPRLNSSGTLSLKTEFLKSTQISYRSGVYPGGYTYNGNIIGHHIGPDAWGNYTRLSYMLTPDVKLGFDFHYERHGRLGLSQFTIPYPTTIFEKPEDRYGFIFSCSRKLMKNLRLISAFGYERIQNYFFKSGSNKNDFLVSFLVKYDF